MDWNSDGIRDVMVQAVNGVGSVNYVVKSATNTTLYNGTPAGISGIGASYIGQ